MVTGALGATPASLRVVRLVCLSSLKRDRRKLTARVLNGYIYIYLYRYIYEQIYIYIYFFFSFGTEEASTNIPASSSKTQRGLNFEQGTANTATGKQIRAHSLSAAVATRL